MFAELALSRHVDARGARAQPGIKPHLPASRDYYYILASVIVMSSLPVLLLVNWLVLQLWLPTAAVSISKLR